MLVKRDRSSVVADSADSPLPAVFVHFVTMDGAIAWLRALDAPGSLRAGNAGPADLKSNLVLSQDLCFVAGSSRSGFEFIFEESFDGYGISLPVAGSIRLTTPEKKTSIFDLNQGAIADLITVAAVHHSPHCEFRSMALRSAALHRRIELITEQPVRKRVVFAPGFQKNSGPSKFIFAVGQALMAGLQGDAPLRRAPAAVASLKDAILSMFVEGMPHNHSELLSRRSVLPAPRNVRRAIEFMRAHVTDALLLEDIAVAAQTSPRSLQTAFRQFRGVTPMEYLRRLRLDGARNEMLNSAGRAAVSEIAYRWGFAHHGIFSTRYKLAFGESPSETLKRCRAV